MNIINNISEDIAKKIIGNKENAGKFLDALLKKKGKKPKTRIINRGKNKGVVKLDYETKELWKIIIDEWEYEIAKDIIRNLFKETKKYQNGKEGISAMKILVDEWQKLNLDKISWPFSQGEFDSFVQRINSETINGYKKDEKVKLAAVKYRRIKEMNTVRNDFIETLIFEKYDNILPTLNHNKGVDFFINGESYDQKVSKSPTGKFINKFKNQGWKEFAIRNPKIVAEYLYKHQAEGRFAADSRLLIVYLDTDVTTERIVEIIENTDFTKPLEVSFTFRHKNMPEKSYKVTCIVVLLYNVI